MDGRQLLHLGEEILQQIASDLDILEGAYGLQLLSLSSETGFIKAVIRSANDEDALGGVFSPAIVKPLVAESGLDIVSSVLCSLSAKNAINDELIARSQLFMICADCFRSLQSVNSASQQYLLAFYDYENGNNFLDYEFLDEYALTEWARMSQSYAAYQHGIENDDFFDGVDDLDYFSSGFVARVELDDIVIDGENFNEHFLLSAWSVLAPFSQAFDFMVEYLQQMRCYLS